MSEELKKDNACGEEGCGRLARRIPCSISSGEKGRLAIKYLAPERPLKKSPLAEGLSAGLPSTQVA